MKNLHPQQRPTNKKAHWFSLTTYASDEQLKDFANAHSANLEYMAYIEHDKDKLENGEPKTTHKHILIKSFNQITITTLRNKFERASFVDEHGKAVTTLCEYTQSAKGSYEYLIHKNHPQKAQYSETDIITLLGDVSIVECARCGPSTTTPRKDNTFEILQQLAQGASKWTLAKKYGRDYILNANKYDYLLAQLNPVEMRQAYHGMSESDAVAGAIEAATEDAKQWREWIDTNTQIFESDARAREEARNEEKYNYKPTLDDWR